MELPNTSISHHTWESTGSSMASMPTSISVPSLSTQSFHHHKKALIGGGSASNLTYACGSFRMFLHVHMY